VEVFFGVQNLFDQAYYVGTLPTTTGTPRFASGGLRVRFAAQSATR
jgi:outer membrane receptor protein involved in Fe transport